MKYNKKKLLVGALILAIGLILAIPVLADLNDENSTWPQLYYFDEETGEYVPWYPPWYDPENPEASIPPEGCPWWDKDGNGEFDWMPHWGRRWSNPENGQNGYGWGRGGCGGYGPRSGRGYQSG